MKTRNRIKAVCLLCIFLSGCAIASCSRDQDESSLIIERDSAAFIATEISILKKEKQTIDHVMDACLFRNSIILLQNIYETDGGVQSEVISIDQNGSVQSSLQLKTETGEPLSGTSIYAADDSLYVLAQDLMTGKTELLKLDSDEKTITKRTMFTLDELGYCSDFIVVGDTCVLLVDQTLMAYVGGTFVKQLIIPGFLLIEQIAEANGKILYLFNDGSNDYLGRWNCNAGETDKFPIDSLIPGSMTGWCRSSNNFYVETSAGIFQIDGENKKLNEILSWNDTDIAPSRYVFNITDDYVLSPDLIVRFIMPVSSQENESSECHILRHTDIDPSSGKTILTIGGYGAARDTILQYAVYRFNITDSDYRFEIRDYSEIYPFSDLASYNRAIANIIIDMSDGKGQDILYGNLAFNYNKLAENGLLLDMKPYLDNDPDISEESWLPSIYDLMEKNGSLYFFFPAFAIKGYLTNQDYFPSTDIVSCRDVLEKARDTTFSGTIIPGVKAADLLRGALLYSMDSYRDASGKFIITSEQLEELVEYARQVGSTEGLITTSSPEQSYLLGQQAMLYSYIFCPQDFYRYQQLSSSPSIYVGYPSQKESARLCTPLDIVEISSGTKYPDACWEFVKIMMSEEVQQKSVEINAIPVSQEGFEDLLEKAANPDLRSSAENTALHMSVQTEIPAESITEFRDLVDSICAMEYYDTRLSAIIDEICAPCLSGDKSASDVVTDLNDRINLYLSE